MTFVRSEDLLAVADHESGLCLKQEAWDKERTWWLLSLGQDVVRFTTQMQVTPSTDPSNTDEVHLFKIDGPYEKPCRLGADSSADAVKQRIEQALQGWSKTLPANRGIRFGVAFEHA